MTDKDTIIAAQEAEILRLQSALDDLKNWAISNYRFESLSQGLGDEIVDLAELIDQIEKITGASND